MATTLNIRVPARFNGPDDHANGGYLCGLLAAQLPWRAEFTLRKMIPVEADLELEISDQSASLLQGENVLVTARPGVLSEIILPDNPGFKVARELGTHAWQSRSLGNYPNCYVCGRHRGKGDGMQLHAAPLPQSNNYCTAWIPETYMTTGKSELVDPKFIFAALDCPGADAAVAGRALRVLLGRFTVGVFREIKAGEQCVILAWCEKREGRKHFSQTLIYGENGAVAARGEAIWFTV